MSSLPNSTISRSLTAVAGIALLAASLAPGKLSTIGGPELGALFVFLGILIGVYLLFYALTGKWLWTLRSRPGGD